MTDTAPATGIAPATGTAPAIQLKGISKALGPVQADIDNAEADKRELTHSEQYCLDNYPGIVGELSYYARTCRPDSSYVLSKLSTRQKDPDKAAATWTSQSLRCLKTTADRQMEFTSCVEE